MVILLLNLTAIAHQLEPLLEGEADEGSDNPPTHRYQGVPIHFDAYGRPLYLCEEGLLPELMLPEPLEEHVAGIVWGVDHPESPFPPGRYRLETATLTVGKDGKAAITGRRLDDAFALRQALRFDPGKILPVEQWDMGPKPEPTATLPTAEIQASQDPKSISIKFACPACKAKYTINGEKMRGSDVRMKCRKCEQRFLVPKPVPAPQAAEAAPPN